MDSNQGPSAYRSNALSLGQTGSQGGVDIDVLKAIFLHVHLSDKFTCCKQCFRWMDILMLAKLLLAVLGNCVSKILLLVLLKAVV